MAFKRSGVRDPLAPHLLDLGGEGRGTRKTENVFAIQTPVAIAVAVRVGKAKKAKPAKPGIIEPHKNASRVIRETFYMPQIIVEGGYFR